MSPPRCGACWNWWRRPRGAGRSWSMGLRTGRCAGDVGVDRQGGEVLGGGAGVAGEGWRGRGVVPATGVGAGYPPSSGGGCGGAPFRAPVP